MAADISDKNKDYGLPKVEPEPINRDQPGVAKEAIVDDPETPKRNNKLLWIVISIVVLLIAASLLYMTFSDDDTENSPSSVTERDEGSDPNMDNQGDEGDEELLADAENEGDDLGQPELSNDEPGSITTISQRTNRYYIFVGSYKFRAYAQRHADRLAADGFAVKLITPDNWVGMRVAVGNYANEDEARVDAQQIKSKYGIEVVISKY